MSNIVAQRTNGQWRKRNGSWGSRDVWGSEKNEDETKFGVFFLDFLTSQGWSPDLQTSSLTRFNKKIPFLGFIYRDWIRWERSETFTSVLKSSVETWTPDDGREAACRWRRAPGHAPHPPPFVYRGSVFGSTPSLSNCNNEVEELEIIRRPFVLLSHQVLHELRKIANTAALPR